MGRKLDLDRTEGERVSELECPAREIVGIAGVLLGLFADRLLQRQGNVRCEIEPIELWVFSGDGSTHNPHSLPIRDDILRDEGSEPYYSGEDGTRYFANAKLFNEKEVKTGLRDVVVVFDGQHPLERTMLDRSTWRGPDGSMDGLEVGTSLRGSGSRSLSWTSYLWSAPES
jgi:hypothetical protein